jgi:phosphoesterase RecJ-like protein
MRKFHRGERVGEEIRRIISELLLRELKDPALGGMISISYVKAADDGSFATVYFTSFGGDEEAAVKGFEKAKGFIRSEIGKRLSLRHTPDLRFEPDATEQYGQHIDAILNEIEIPAEAQNEPLGREVGLGAIADIIDSYERVFVFTHTHMDGDTFGAATALVLTLREVGKEAWVVVGEEPPRSLSFIRYGAATNAEEAAEILARSDAPYLAVAVDHSGLDRIEGREALFRGAAETLCIDHHISSKPLYDYNLIEADAAATAELVYRYIIDADLPMNEDIATALYVGVVTDTGRFQYPSTTPETHRIASALLEAGADFTTAYAEIYQNVKAGKLLVECAMLNTMDIFADGKAVMAWVLNETLQKLDAGDDETDGMSEKLRSIIGVEVSIFLKELGDGKVKASMRSKDSFDVAAFAVSFGGGGHVRAAGFTTELPMAEAVRQLKEKLAEALR